MGPFGKGPPGPSGKCIAFNKKLDHKLAWFGRGAPETDLGALRKRSSRIGRKSEACSETLSNGMIWLGLGAPEACSGWHLGLCFQLPKCIVISTRMRVRMASCECLPRGAVRPPEDY